MGPEKILKIRGTPTPKPSHLSLPQKKPSLPLWPQLGNDRESPEGEETAVGDENKREVERGEKKGSGSKEGWEVTSFTTVKQNRNKERGLGAAADGHTHEEEFVRVQET